MERPTQKPLELILARNLLSSVVTPGFLVDAPGDLIFYNEAAGALLGRRFEEQGATSGEDWINMYGPLDDSGEPIPLEEQPLTRALRRNQAAHARHRIRSFNGAQHEVAVTGLPIIGSGGFSGAMIFFWPVAKDER